MDVGDDHRVRTLFHRLRQLAKLVESLLLACDVSKAPDPSDDLPGEVLRSGEEFECSAVPEDDGVPTLLINMDMQIPDAV
jgi:hypothetical protein